MWLRGVHCLLGGACWWSDLWHGCVVSDLEHICLTKSTSVSVSLRCYGDNAWGLGQRTLFSDHIVDLFLGPGRGALGELVLLFLLHALVGRLVVAQVLCLVLLDDAHVDVAARAEVVEIPELIAAATSCTASARSISFVHPDSNTAIAARLPEPMVT